MAGGSGGRFGKKGEKTMKTYATMPTMNVEEDWIKGLLLFGSDYAFAYLGMYKNRDDYWHMLDEDDKIKAIEEKMPPPSDGWQNRPFAVAAPNIMAVKTDALGRVWRAHEVYESRSRNTTLIRYHGISSNVYGYEYVELVTSEASSMWELSICKEWADGDASFEDIQKFLDE
jgi:hypothetical protein